MAPPLAPCNWYPLPCGCDLPGYGADGESGAGPDDPTRYAVETAQYVLWALSGRQFGTCEVTVRPCRSDCSGGATAAWGARLVDGSWVNLPCRSCVGGCSCVDVCEVRLPFTPVYRVLDVYADGALLAEDLWRLEDQAWVVLDPAAACFPECQDMSVALGQPGTWGVVFEHGTPPPVAGRRAVGALACEILKACRGDSKCGLPKRTQQWTANGVTAVMIDPFEFFDKQRTGIYEVDLFLAAANPEGRSRAARIVSPDAGDRPRAVW